MWEADDNSGSFFGNTTLGSVATRTKAPSSYPQPNSNRSKLETASYYPNEPTGDTDSLLRGQHFLEHASEPGQDNCSKQENQTTYIPRHSSCEVVAAQTNLN